MAEYVTSSLGANLSAGLPRSVVLFFFFFFFEKLNAKESQMHRFRILLDDPQPAYTSGSTIGGNVVLNSPVAEEVGLVNITFSGRGKTKLRKGHGDNSRIVRGRAPLFRQTKTLYSGHFKLRASRYSWPFVFTFPEQSDPRCTEDTFSEDPRFLRTGTAHPLPPTFKLYGGRARSQGMIEYKLEARLDRSSDHSSFSSGHLEDAIELMYLPLRANADPNHGYYSTEQPYHARTLRLLPNREELTVKEKLHSLFSSSKLPSANFVLRVTYPTRTYPGRRLPIQLSVAEMAVSEDVPTPPNVILESISVGIKSYFEFRASAFISSCASEITEKEFLLRTFDTRVAIPVSRSPFLKISFRRTQPSDLQDAADCFGLDELRGRSDLVTPALCPSFKSINVAIAYKLKVKMRLLCAGTNCNLEISEPLEVLSPVYALEPSSTAGQSEATAERQIALPLPQDLPRYTEQEGSDGDEVVMSGPSEAPPRYEAATGAVVAREQKTVEQ